MIESGRIVRVSLSPGDGLRRNDVVILILLLRLLSLLFVIELLVHDHSSPEEEALKEHAHRRYFVRLFQAATFSLFSRLLLKQDHKPQRKRTRSQGPASPARGPTQYHTKTVVIVARYSLFYWLGTIARVVQERR